MPGFDGRGPLGQGPGSGWGRGYCPTGVNAAARGRGALGVGRGFGRGLAGGLARGLGRGIRCWGLGWGLGFFERAVNPQMNEALLKERQAYLKKELAYVEDLLQKNGNNEE